MVGTLVAVVLAFALADTASAQGGVRIESGSIRLHNGVHLLDMDVHYELSAAAREALDSGVALVMVIDIRIQRQRWWWWDATVASRSVRYRAKYHALSERYLLTGVESGESRTFRSLGSLLYALGRVRALPVVKAERLQPGVEYEAQVRAGLDLDALPRPLRAVAYLSPDWRLFSDWRTWLLES